MVSIALFAEKGATMSARGQFHEGTEIATLRIEAGTDGITVHFNSIEELKAFCDNHNIDCVVDEVSE